MIVKELNLKDPKYVRAGIIPFIEINGTKFYAFGLEPHIAAIGDFGGHKEDIDNDLLDSAIREYSEEGLDIFGKLNREQLLECEVLDGTNTFEILVPISNDHSLYYYTKEFQKLVLGNYKHEVQNIIWLSSQQLLLAIDNPSFSIGSVKLFHMYEPIYNTLLLNKSMI